MTSIFEGVERAVGPLHVPEAAMASESDPPLSPDVRRGLHQDLVRRKRRAFLAVLPLLLLAAYAWAGALTDPRTFGGLAVLAAVTVAMIGQTGYEWWTLRGADPLRLYDREQQQGERYRAELIAHEARTAQVRPVASLALTGVILIVTAVQFVITPTTKWLDAGGLVKPAVKAGEWWRLLTCSYLHGNVMHIIANAGGLMMLGRLIETYNRRMRIPLIYLLSVIGGSIVSTMTFAQPSVGASGGVLGLAGYLLVVAGRPGSGMPDWIRRRMLSILGMTLLVGTAAYFFIDNAAHLGGAVTGAALGLAMRPAASSDPPDAFDALGALASVILAAGAVFTINRLLA